MPTNFYLGLDFYKKIRIISHLHHNAPWLSNLNLKSILYATSISRYSNIILVSPHVYEQYIFKNMLRDKYIVLQNPMDIKEKEKYIVPINDRKYDSIFVGRLEEVKQPVLAFEIFDELGKINNQLKFAIVGDGSLYEEIKIRVQKNKNIELLGFKENVFEYLGQSKTICIPSKWEGFGLVAVEAMSVGTVVLCSGKGSLNDLVSQKEGLICETIDEYLNELQNLLNDYKYLYKKSKNCIIKSYEYNNIYKYKKVIRGIYNDD